MEPNFRFCASADGTRIAYATYGSGPPLLYTNTWVLSMDAQFRIPEARLYFDALASHTQLVIFDRRGSGASERDVDDLSPEAEAQDIGAVAAAASLRDFTLFSEIATAACATYAATDQQRLRKLVLWCPFVEIRAGPSRDREIARAFRKDWSYARRLWSSQLFPQGPVSLQRTINRAFKDTTSAETAAQRFELEALVDFRALLPGVQAPALVLQRETWGRMETMHLAALLPNGQVRFVAGGPPTTYPDHEPIVEAVHEFMGLSQPASHAPQIPGGTTVILFTDIADSAALTERMGDAAFRERSRLLDERVRSAMRAHGGTPVEGKVLGDGVMGVFTVRRAGDLGRSEVRRTRTRAADAHRPARRRCPQRRDERLRRRRQHRLAHLRTLGARRDPRLAHRRRSRAHVGGRDVRRPRRACSQGHRRTACECSRWCQLQSKLRP